MSKLALVTGATSGIGRAYAGALAATGYDLIAVGRNRTRLDELVATLPTRITPVEADLATASGIDRVADLAAAQPLDLLVNNAGVAHYMPLAQLPAERASELIHVKELTPTLLTRAALPGMLERGAGDIVNVAGMLAFGGPAPQSPGGGRAIYVATLAHLLAFSQALAVELADTAVSVQVCCPGIVATEFHTRQGMDLSAVPRMSPEDVVSASLRGLELGEVVCAPGVEDVSLLDAVVGADLAAFGGQSPQLATRYRPA